MKSDKPEYVDKNTKEPTAPMLKEAAEVLIDYAKPNSMVDEGNLFFAACEFQSALTELQGKLDAARDCLKTVEIKLAGCMHKGFPINVRELDGSISQHLPTTNAGDAYNLVRETLAKIGEK